MFHRALSVVLPVAIAAAVPAQEHAPLGGALPVIATVGDAPQGAFVFEVHSNGILSRNGIPLTFGEWAGELEKAARARRGKKVGGLTLSDLPVLIRADATVPSTAIGELLWVCGRREIATTEVFLAVRHQHDGSEGAFAWFLPIDSARPDQRPSGEELSIDLTPQEGEGDPAALQAALYRYLQAMEPEQRRRAVAPITVPGDLAWGVTMRIADAISRAGVPFASLRLRLTVKQERAWNIPATRHDLRALCAAEETDTRVPQIKIGPVRIGATSAVPERVARVRGAAVGFMRNDLHVAEEEIAEEDIVEEPILRDEEIEEVAVEVEHALDEPVPETEPAQRRIRRKVPATAARAIDAGLRWLAAHQDEVGGWDADDFMKHDLERLGAATDGLGNSVYDVGVTGLALLAFMGDGNTLRSGPYKNNVKKGINWLRGQQDEDGLFGTNASHDFIYGHAVAALAMIEGYGLSNYKMLRKSAQRGLDYLERHRNPYVVWRYQPRDNANDTSVTSWCVMAIIAGQHFGLEVNPRAPKFAATWFDSVVDPESGRHGYIRPGTVSSRRAGDHAERFPPEKNESLTGAALFCRYLLGQNPKQHPVMKTAADLVMNKLPSWEPAGGTIDYYAWFYGSHALNQHGETDHRRYYQALTRALCPNQRQDGNFAGSWDPIGVWGEDGGRIYSTAMGVLALESPYRIARPR